jgi:hypothetical protein
MAGLQKQSYGAAVTPMSEIKYIAGEKHVSRIVSEPYSDATIAFLDDLSHELKADRRSSEHPDVLTFAFWIRKANMTRLKKVFGDTKKRLGRGIMLHITPSNIPINFAYSFVFGLLSGNANIVRLPSKRYYQVDIVCDALNDLFERKKYESIKRTSSFITYPRSDEISANISKECDGRVIWGGDDTVSAIRKLPMSPRGVELAFADRYSLCVIGQEALHVIQEKELARLAERFYNDTYLVDQNACSSPYLVVWLGKKDEAVQERFWNAVYSVVAKKYDLEPISSVDKYTRFCEAAVLLDSASLKRMGNFIYRVRVKELSEELPRYKEHSGFFYEYTAKNLADIAHIITDKYQTLTYFGVDKEPLLDFVIKNKLSGIDRIVPIGQALDIGLVWDGYDVVRTLSRVVEAR